MLDLLHTHTHTHTHTHIYIYIYTIIFDVSFVVFIKNISTDIGPPPFFFVAKKRIEGFPKREGGNRGGRVQGGHCFLFFYNCKDIFIIVRLRYILVKIVSSNPTSIK